MSQAARLHITEQLPPALGAFAKARLEADQLFLAFPRGADDDQHAFGLLFHSRLQINAVRPQINITPRRQVTLLPTGKIIFPCCFQARHDSRGNVWRVLAKQRRERHLEIAT